MRNHSALKKIFIFMSCSMLPLAGFSENREITVDEAVKLALENNVSISRNEITLNALKRAKDHSWNSASPSVSFEGNSGIPINGMTSDAVKAKYDASFGLGATISVSLTANLYTKMQAAKYNYEIGEISFSDAVKDVELKVRQTFYGLLYKKENINLQQKNSDISKSQYNANLAKYNQGRLSELDVLSAEVSYKSTIPTVEEAKTSYENDLSSFKQLLGIDFDEEITLKGKLEDKIILKEINLDGIEVNSSKIKTLEKRLDAAENSILDSRFSAFAPTVRANFNWKYQSWYAGYDGKEPDPNSSASLSLSASIPLDGLLPWSAKHDGMEKELDSKKDYELQLKDARNTLQMSIDSYLRSIKNSQASIKAKQANVTLAKKRYTMTLDAYNRGAKDFMTLQNANSSLLNAEVSLQNEIRNLINSILNLESTIGVPFGTLGK